MTVNRTTLLDLPLPVTGTGSGTWGDTTNNGLSQYTDIAIAGMNSLTSANFTAGALTIANTLGDSLATNIAAGSAQFSTIKVSSLAQNSTITAPGNSGTPPVYSGRSYRIINADATYSLTIKASGQTGVTFLPGQTGVVAFNGTDYVIVGVVGAGTATDNAVVRFDGTTGKLVQNSVVTIADSTGDISGVGQLNATTVDTTNLEVTNIKAKDGTASATIADSTGVVSLSANPVLSGGTANGVLYLNGSKVATSGSALTFDGTTLQFSNSTLAAFNIYNSSAATDEKNYTWQSGSSVGNGIYRLRLANDAATSGNNAWVIDRTGTDIDYQAWGAGSSEAMRLTSTGLGIGTSSISGKLSLNESDLPFMTIKRADTVKTYFGVGNGSSLSGQAAAGDTVLRAEQKLVLRSGGDTGGATLDSSGNLGLGVTPSAWYTSGSTVAQVRQASFYAVDNIALEIGNNAFLTSGGSTWNYINTGFATRYNSSSGAHKWFTAPSGTAGNAITFSQVMTLDASGNLGIGTTSPANNGATFGTLSLNGSNGGALHFMTANTTIMQQYNDANAFFLNAGSGKQIIFQNNSAERARITSGGDLLVGTTTTRTSNGQATQRLQIQGSSSTDGGAAVNSFGNDAFASNVDFFKSRGTGSTNTIVQSGDTLGKIWWSGADGTAYIQAAGITAEVDGTPGTNDMPGRLVFFTTADGATLVTERMRITSGGEVYIAGTTDQGAYNLQCNGTGVWGAGAYVNGSDERLKDDIQSLDSCLNVVNALRPVTFKYKPEHSKDQSVQTGFIAQELQQVLAGKPYLEGLVQEGPQHLNVAYQNIIPLLAKAIQEQQALIESLTSRVAQLEGA